MRKLLITFLLLLFTLPFYGQVSTFTDARDSQVYNKITIGTQVWMAENLNYETDESWCYTNDTADCTIYGRLYYWEQADTICPAGWHLPTDAEWIILEEYIGMSSAYSARTGYKLDGEVGYNLKATTYWGTGAIGADTYLFSALPAGFRKPGGNYMSQGYNALFWTDTESSSQAYGRLLFVMKGIERTLYTKQYGASVRCVKD